MAVVCHRKRQICDDGRGDRTLFRRACVCGRPHSQMEKEGRGPNKLLVGAETVRVEKVCRLMQERQDVEITNRELRMH